MKPDPLQFTFLTEDFDLEKLPISADLLKADRPMLETAITAYYAEQFRPVGGQAQIAIYKGVVTVQWVPESGLGGLVEHAIALLKREEYGLGVPMLRSALQRAPDDPAILLNLGKALSETDHTDEAGKLLKRLLELQPANATAWDALGMAYVRAGEADSAEKCLRKSLEIDPKFGSAVLNLGCLLSKSSPKDGLPLLKRAAELMPDDQTAQCRHGLALLDSGDPITADPILRRVVEMNPLTPQAELAQKALTKLAHKELRDKGGGRIRMDAVMYCLAALRLAQKDPVKMRAITFEIALLGKRGFDINDPEPKYTLKSLEGKFSGFHLVSYMYVGVKQLDPNRDPGIDLSAEYEQAQMLFRAEQG